MRRFGVLYQSGALWSSMTLAENVALPLGEYTDLDAGRDPRGRVAQARAGRARRGSRTTIPSEISGGMRKRAGLARAMALDPEVLFFDEPSAGLDPISSRLLDDLILELRDSLGATVVMVTHELPSIFAIANNSVFLDPETKSQLATGDPHELLAHPPDPKVEKFLTRGGSERPDEHASGGRSQRGNERMSKANPAVIGGFVIGAIALVVIGLLAFGGTNWFAKRNKYVAYFPGSVKGLQVGAPVDFRGVTIGRVTDIKVLFNPEEVSARIPVVMEFDPTQIEVVGGEPIMAGAEGAKRLIDAGFRAQLQSQSLLTGLLFVNLDFLPKSPVRLVGGDAALSGDPDHSVRIRAAAADRR